jgi:eukaryotic-like serine/threonine-protein kinase
MPLSAGDKLGHYEVLSLLGQGGMGEVYRAKDTKLDRRVAIKVLPSALARDAERLARFEREAKVLASLDHPNIGHIYGLVDAEDSHALVLALIEGPTLADQIAIGPLPLDDSLSIAKQIIEALEYAHDRGVIHRDLKPANIKITPEGVVKVLDFGLARVLEEEPPASSLGNSPTLTIGHTRAGVILGTAAYMSPEQAIGRPVDRRSDIFSFGAVLYEMLAGKPVFDGVTTPDVLEAVVRNDPDWSKLPVGTPRNLRRLLERMLAKDRKQRLQAIGEARIVLAQPLSEEPAPATLPAPSQSRLGKLWPGIAAVFALAAATVSFLHFRETPPPPERTFRYTIAAPENSAVSSFAVSPDGRLLVMAAAVNGKSQLWLRPLDALQTQAMPATDDASFPFWSPDSRYIGFFAQGKLKKISASGGPSQSLCDAPNGRGGSWNQDDVIIFSGLSGAIQRVGSAGGVPTQVTRMPARFPAFLPDGRHFLHLGGRREGGIYVGSLDGKEERRILPDLSNAVFAPLMSGSRAGHIFFARENNLMALPFDAGTAQPSGEVFPVADGVSTLNALNYLAVTASTSGVVVYRSGLVGTLGSQLVWYDRTGKPQHIVGEPGQVLVQSPAIAPDERVVAYMRRNGASQDIWLRDLARDTDTRFTTTGLPFAPIWSPKGDRIVFPVNVGGLVGIQQKASSGSSKEEMLLPASSLAIPYHWSHDGRSLVYAQNDAKTAFDLWYLPVEENAPPAKPVLFLQTEFNELMGQISPDSHWMAFTSDKSGQREIYVRPFPSGDGEWKVSTAGGEQPRWRGDGKELFYSAADGKINAVPVLKAAPGARPEFEPGVPVALFESHILNVPGANNIYEYDVTADGKRFLVATTGASPAAASPPLTVVLNWNAGLKK